MRESMLLQAADDLLRGELRGLRAELGRLAGSPAGPCAPAAPAEARLGPALDELLRASRDAGRRLARLEGAGAQRPEEAGGALGAVLEELRRTREDLRAVQRWAARRWLPAGKDHGHEGTSLRLCSPSARAGKPGQATLQAHAHGRTAPPSPAPFLHAWPQGSDTLYMAGRLAFESVSQSRGGSCGRDHQSLELGESPLLTPDPPGPAGGAPWASCKPGPPALSLRCPSVR